MLSSLYVRLEARLSLFLKIFGRAGWGCFVNVMVSDNRKFFLFFSPKYLHSTLDILALSKISNGHFFFILQRICIIPSDYLLCPFLALPTADLRTFFDINKRLSTEPRAVTGFLLFFFLLERGYHKNSQPLTFIRLSCRQNLPTFFLLLSNRNQGVKRRICHTQCRHSNIHHRIGARNTGKSEKGRVQTIECASC